MVAAVLVAVQIGGSVRLSGAVVAPGGAVRAVVLAIPVAAGVALAVAAISVVVARVIAGKRASCRRFQIGIGRGSIGY